MKLEELLDKVYDTIKLHVNIDGSADASFRTENDTYKVSFTRDELKEIQIGQEIVEVPLVSITFMSGIISMGHLSTDNEMVTNPPLIYSTIVQIALKFVEARQQMHKPVYGFSCSVAGDNTRGAKRRIYELLFAAATKFGYHKWKDELKAIQLKTWKRLKKSGFKSIVGELIFDDKL